MYLYARKWTSVIHKVLVNVSSQYAYTITCLCTLVQLIVSGLSTCTLVQLIVSGLPTFPAVVNCMFVSYGVLCLFFVLFLYR